MSAEQLQAGLPRQMDGESGLIRENRGRIFVTTRSQKVSWFRFAMKIESYIELRFPKRPNFASIQTFCPYLNSCSQNTDGAKIDSSNRQGTAAVELAVCLPIFVLIVVSTLDICGMFFVQQSLTTSAYEGARIGIVPNAKSENVVFQIETLLDSQGIEGYSINLEPANPEMLSVGDYFTVTVNANFDQNAIVGGIYGGKTLSKSATLRVE